MSLPWMWIQSNPTISNKSSHAICYSTCCRLMHTTPCDLLWDIVWGMMTSSNGNAFRITGPLCGEFTGHRWIPHTMAIDVELWCFLSFTAPGLKIPIYLDDLDGIGKMNNVHNFCSRFIPDITSFKSTRLPSVSIRRHTCTATSQWHTNV